MAQPASWHAPTTPLPRYAKASATACSSEVPWARSRWVSMQRDASRTQSSPWSATALPRYAKDSATACSIAGTPSILSGIPSPVVDSGWRHRLVPHPSFPPRVLFAWGLPSSTRHLLRRHARGFLFRRPYGRFLVEGGRPFHQQLDRRGPPSLEGSLRGSDSGRSPPSPSPGAQILGFRK